MFLSIRIRQHERGLLFRYGDFVGVIRPGKHWLWSRLINPLRAEVQVVNTLNSRFEHPMLDVLLQHEDFVGALAIVENSDTQRAIVWKDGRVLCVLGPGRFAFWTTPAKVRIEQFDIESFRFQHRNVQDRLQLRPFTPPLSPRSTATRSKRDITLTSIGTNDRPAPSLYQIPRL